MTARASSPGDGPRGRSELEGARDLIAAIQELSLARDVEAVQAVVRRAARRLSGADGATFVLRDGDSCYYADEDAIAPLWKGRRFPMTSCVSGWVMLNRTPAVIQDVFADPRVPADAYRPTFVRSLAMVPIRVAAPIGAIGCYWASHHEATALELRLIQALADSTSTALENVRLNMELALRVEESKQHLQAAEAALQARDAFLSIASHELRNPLTPIQNGLHLLEVELPEDARAHRTLEIMERQLGHLRRLVDDLVDVSLLSKDRVVLSPAPEELNAIVADVVGDLRGATESKGLTLEVVPLQDRLPVRADRTRLSQALSGLIDNAVKYSEEGGAVFVTLGREGSQAVVRVRDQGVGIDPALLPRLFQPFAQAERGLDRTRGGLGLGLVIAQQIVQLHGGTVEVRSEGVGWGAESVVRLPLAEARRGDAALAPASSPHEGSAGPHAARSEADPEPLQGASPPRRVLVVDDNADAAMTLRDALELFGHAVEVAYDGPGALTAAREFRPEAVLCDIGLPGMDGCEVAARLRADSELGTAFLVALTGYSLPADLARSREAGFDLHLVKPPNITELHELLVRLPARAADGVARR